MITTNAKIGCVLNCDRKNILIFRKQDYVGLTILSDVPSALGSVLAILVRLALGCARSTLVVLAMRGWLLVRSECRLFWNCYWSFAVAHIFSVPISPGFALSKNDCHISCLTSTAKAKEISFPRLFLVPIGGYVISLS